jgi:predicted phage terminase large subunit-like protein
MVKSDAEANSPVILENIHDTVYSDVLNALHGAKSIAVMIGTPYNKNDPVYKAIETGAWVPVVFPICKTIRSNLKKEEFKGVWEDRHSYEAVMKRWRKAVKGNTVNAFMKELMLRISNEEDRMIKEDWIEWFDRGNVLQNAHKYNWYFTSDYTTTGGEDSDLSGAAIWAVNSAGDYMLVDLILDKMDLVFQYEETFRLINAYKKRAGYLPAGIEIDGQQKVHIFALKQMMQQRGEYFTIAMQKGSNHIGIKSGGVKKIDRFRPMVPMFQNHKIWFANELKGTPQMDELLDELKYLTHAAANSKHDDGLDLISQMNSMPIIIPADDGTTQNTIDSISEYESHNVYHKYDSDIYKGDEEDKSSYIF